MGRYKRALMALVAAGAVVTATFAATSAGPAVAATSGCADLPKADGGTWTCTFSDDFDGSVLDPTKWQPLTTAATGFTGGGECLVNNGRTISVSEGALHLTTRRVPPFSCRQIGTSFKTRYESGAVWTNGLFSQAFGRFEFRARFPDVTQPGLAQALWLYPDKATYGKWPLSGEIDVAEHYSAWPNWVNYNLKYGGWDTDPTRSARTTCRIGDATAFHTYALEWTPSLMTFVYDGQTCWSTTWQATGLTTPQPFDQPFHLMMNQSLGVGTNAPTSATTLPATMDLDWVRAWS